MRGVRYDQRLDGRPARRARSDRLIRNRESRKDVKRMGVMKSWKLSQRRWWMGWGCLLV